MELHELVERIERWKNRQAGNEESPPFSVPAQDSFMEQESHASEPEAFQEESTKDFDIQQYIESHEKMDPDETVHDDTNEEPAPGATYDSEDPVDFSSEEDEDEGDLNRISLSDFEEVK
jgi:hypothetical protein